LSGAHFVLFGDDRQCTDLLSDLFTIGALGVAKGIVLDRRLRRHRWRVKSYEYFPACTASYDAYAASIFKHLFSPSAGVMNSISMPDKRPVIPANVTRRTFIGTAALVSGIAAIPDARAAPARPHGELCSLTINNVRHDMELDFRTTLLDLLREQLHLVGTKKGCDHGQCGACTVIANGERILSCLSLAVAYDGAHITTIEGLAESGQLHPMQAAFIEHDAFQCGFCTPGQICSAVAMLEEARKGMPSVVTANLSASGGADLTEAEIRERMSGNICRCGAYPNIVAAVRAVDRGSKS
jgi:xanthine dehydrogenase YagT iron-sulfur-binding subunit